VKKSRWGGGGWGEPAVVPASWGETLWADSQNVPNIETSLGERPSIDVSPKGGKTARRGNLVKKESESSDEGSEGYA